MAQESYKDQEGLFSNCPFIFRGAGQRAGGGWRGGGQRGLGVEDKEG